MPSVSAWLETLGLGRYGPVFEANDVDLPVLAVLTDDELRDLGVMLGHRKRILQALGRIGPGPAPATIPPGVEALTRDGERRQVTVLFCDLVGSTRLSARLDPEYYRELLARYHECCITAIQRFEGYVTQVQGDGVLAYFGYPIAHEAETERAIRAALAIVESLDGMRLGEALAARIGVASGRAANCMRASPAPYATVFPTWRGPSRSSWHAITRKSASRRRLCRSAVLAFGWRARAGARGARRGDRASRGGEPDQPPAARRQRHGPRATGDTDAAGDGTPVESRLGRTGSHGRPGAGP